MSLLSRLFAAKSAKPVLRSTALYLECLEARDCPAAPTITNFAALIVSGNAVELTGNVGDDHQNTLTLNVSGAGSVSSTVAINSTLTGQFSLTLNPNSMNGTFFAQVVDDQMATSSTVQATAGNAPTLTASVIQQWNHQVVVYGTVSDANPGGLTVTFSGVVSGTVTTAANGTYAYYTTASALGNIQATTRNANGVASNTAQTALTNVAPVISNFTASQSGTSWYLSGEVADEWATGLTVSLTIPGYSSTQQATVGSDDWFSFRCNLAGAYGTAAAQTVDWWGLSSNVAYEIISNDGAGTNG